MRSLAAKRKSTHIIKLIQCQVKQSKRRTAEVQAGDQEKALHQRAVGMKQAPQGSGHGSKLLGLKECLDTADADLNWMTLLVPSGLG